MHAYRLAFFALLTFWCSGASAADLALQNQDCARILESWAQDPKSVPRQLVDACKEQLAAPAPAVAALPPPIAAGAADPCAGPNAASSVLCWGPWAALAPAAAAPLASLDMPEESFDCETGGDLANQCVAQLEPLAATGLEPPVEGCAPGAPCGFATFVAGVTSTGDVEDTSFKRIDLAADGTSFVVDPGGPDEVDSVAMTTNFQPRTTDDYENMRATGTDGDEQSRLIARVIRGDEGEVALAADIWAHGNRETRLGNSGYFAWGTATTQSGLDYLNGNGISLTFTGPMSVDNATNASLKVNFGSQPSWSGTWTNPAWSFGAGGAVNGVNLNSNPAQFTSNVQSGVVQGALLGEPGGPQGIAHVIDVTLAGPGHIRDVGLLRPGPPSPGPDTGLAP